MPFSIRAVRTAATACALFGSLLVAAAPSAEATSSKTPPLEYLGQATIATGTTFDGTVVGGLSGIDYDPATQTYYAISDDRSQLNPARFYTLKIDLADGTLDNGDVTFWSAVTLLDQNGQPFATAAVDPESIRYDPLRGSLFWTSEGDANALLPPFVREATLTGAFVRELDTSSIYFPTANQSSGIRNNLAFESLSFWPGRPRVVTATENALYQDGPAASVTEQSPSRIMEFGTAAGLPKRQFVYLTDTVADVPDPATAFSTNGLVEILAFAPQKYVTVERSFSTGIGNVIKVFVADTTNATDVSGLASVNGQTVTPVKKKLIANFADYGIVPDNIEGVTFGPKLADGRRTLVFVADNNFASTQVTQFVLFAFKPGALQLAVRN